MKLYVVYERKDATGYFQFSRRVPQGQCRVVTGSFPLSQKRQLA
jgi:hypothetical protein